MLPFTRVTVIPADRRGDPEMSPEGGGSLQLWSGVNPTVGKVPFRSSELPHPSSGSSLPIAAPSLTPSIAAAPNAARGRQLPQQLPRGWKLQLFEVFPAACTFSLVLLWLRAALPLLFTGRVQVFRVPDHCLLHQDQQLSSVWDGRTQGRRPSLCPSLHQTPSRQGCDWTVGQFNFCSRDQGTLLREGRGERHL